ncbi:hypothetical protein H0H93_001182 [Arthromyces matolae]|nr:hypothetical protein H0H93_001182 [Arthromyces matolae]
MVSKAKTYSVKIEFGTVFITNNTKENVYLNGVTEIQPNKKEELKPGFTLSYLTFSAAQDAVPFWNLKQDWTIDGKNFNGQLTIEAGFFEGTVEFRYGAGNDQLIVFTKEGFSIKFD